jgi:hypothetical protein
MTDHQDMGTTPTLAEEAAMAVLDRRGRVAAASLRAATASRLDTETTAENSADTAPDTEVVNLRPDGGRRGGDRGEPLGRGRRLWLAVAAAAVVVIGVVAALSGGDGRPGVTSGGEPGYLLPGWLPDGLEPFAAVDGDVVARGSDATAQVAVYGDPSAADPWARTIAVTYVDDAGRAAADAAGDDPAFGLGVSREQIEVGGQPATLTDRDAWYVDWAAGGGTLTVFGSEAVTRDEVLAAAAAASPDVTIGAASLPSGFVEMARGPRYAAGSRFVTEGMPPVGLLVTYTTDGRPHAGDTPGLAVMQRPGDAAAVDLLRLNEATSWSTEVRGQHAVGVTTADPPASNQVALQWLDPSGQLVTIYAVGLSDDEVVRVAEELAPASEADIDHLLREYADDHIPVGDEAADESTGATEDGQAEVASGEQDGLRWTLLAAGNSGEASLELVWGDSSASSSWPVDSGGALELVASVPAGWPGPVVVGTVSPPATSVSVEIPGQPAVDAALHDVPRHGRRAFVVFPPATDALATAAVIARDVDGAEIARDTVVLDPQPG